MTLVGNHLPGSKMTIQDFAERYRAKVTRDACGDAIIQGRLYKDAQIGEHDDGNLCMSMSWLTKESRSKKFNIVKRECLAAGMTIAQEGDDEAVFVFDPGDRVQAKLAIKNIRVRVKRRMTPERAAALAASGAKHRFRQLPDGVNEGFRDLETRDSGKREATHTDQASGREEESPR